MYLKYMYIYVLYLSRSDLFNIKSSSMRIMYIYYILLYNQMYTNTVIN